jgi:CHAD domain-containing protein
VLERRARKLRKLGKRHAELGPAELHRLRIRAKKLRYAADFFRSLYSRKAVRQHATALGDMQDALGAINDTAVGQALLAELADNSGAGKEWMPRAGALVEGWFAALVEAHLGQFAAVWDGYAGLKPFWQRPPATAE